MSSQNSANLTKKFLSTASGKVTIFHLEKLSKLGVTVPGNLPFSIKILLENALRNCDGLKVTLDDVKRIAAWSPHNLQPTEISFKPGRVLLQDFTGVPAMVDLAAMRAAMKRLGGDYKKINPEVPCDLIIDHSMQVDACASPDALRINLKKEFARNQERYKFLKWGQKAFKNFRVIPPGTGIIHQINLEYLAKGILTEKKGSQTIAFPDTLIGTDSHTTMINCLGIVGWGVGGIEAEAVMLGEPISMLLPEVVGVKLTGQMKEGVTATDLVLTLTEILRKKGVVGKFVEFFGDGLGHLTLPDRAVVSNMAPEYGATIGLFPIDNETLKYYLLTGRPKAQVDLVKKYTQAQGMFYSNDQHAPEYSETLTLDLASIESCIAGPKRPQDRIPLPAVKATFRQSLEKPVKERGFGLDAASVGKIAVLKDGTKISHGSIVIASITSCTNTSNPTLLIRAGLVAKKAVEKGMKVPSYVKTSFIPGSQAAKDYLSKAGLLRPLEKLGFHIVGYGCATCIGNSGPIAEDVAKAIQENGLIAASILSGNRNFEGRIHPLTKANYLARPSFVVVYALAGNIMVDLTKDPIGKDNKGNDVFLKDIFPSNKEIDDLVKKNVTTKIFRSSYKSVTGGNKDWKAVKAPKGDLYKWSTKSTYIQEPPFFLNIAKAAGTITEIKGARVLVKVGDSITTDHISPAGSISKESPAGRYLVDLKVGPKDFNSYGARRGNDRVMTRGTFANIRLRNLLVPGSEGAWTVHFPTNEKMSIFDARERYQAAQTPLLVLAGKEYGTGSSRDWAAKGQTLLGVRVVLAQSFERIHRSNLAGMGILPLQFKDGESASSLNLNGDETFDFAGISENLKPRQEITVITQGANGEKKEFKTICRLDTPAEIDYLKNGGILPTVLKKLLSVKRRS